MWDLRRKITEYLLFTRKNFKIKVEFSKKTKYQLLKGKKKNKNNVGFNKKNN